ncbi:hypothetical protein GCM10027300_13370 [Modestobacter lapidis]
MSSGNESPKGANGSDPQPPRVEGLKEPESSKLAVGFDAKGASLAAEGPRAPEDLLRLLLPPALSILGLPAAITVLLADRSLWLVLAALSVPQLMALFWWVILSRVSRVTEPSPAPAK